MKILPLVKGIQNDITSSGIALKRVSVEGYNIANRTAKVYNQGAIRRYLNITRSVTSKVVSNTSSKELPYVAGAIGLMTPIPFMGAIMFGVGLLARFSSPAAHIVYDKISKSHLNFKV